MRVLLTQAKSLSWVSEMVMPLGLCYVGTALANHNHDVRIYDTNIHSDSTDELRKIIRSFEPEIIGVGLRNIDTSSHRVFISFVEPFADLISTLKDIAPTSKIIAGGPGFSIYAQQLMERIPSLEYGIFSEGEASMPELLDNLDRSQSVKGVFYRNDGEVHFTGFREPIDFANLPAPRRDLIDIAPYIEAPFSVNVQTKRGCALKCSHCTYPYIQGSELRVRPVNDVLDELSELADKYCLKSFFFVDSVFNIPDSHARMILEGMRERGLNLQWQSYDEIKYIDKEYLVLAREAGCSLFNFSPDGVSRSTLTALDKEATEQDLQRVSRAIRQVDNIKVFYNFFINAPGESIRNMLHLFRFLLYSVFILRGKAKFPLLYLIRIYPHTPLQEAALEKGIIKKEDNLLGPVFYNPPPLRYIINILTPILRQLVTTVKFLLRIKR